MAARNKMTPFARLLLVVLIVTPLAFVGASIYKGEDPVQNIKSIFSDETTAVVSETKGLESMSKADLIKKIALLETRIEQLEQKIESLESKQ